MTKLPYNPKLKQRATELRKAGNLSEALVWLQLKNRQLKGLKFERQRIIDNYIVDFFCFERMLVIEIDGHSHDEKVEYDAKREDILKGLGLRIIHLLDKDIKKNLQGVMDYLEREIE